MRHSSGLLGERDRAVRPQEEPSSAADVPGCRHNRLLVQPPRVVGVGSHAKGTPMSDEQIPTRQVTPAQDARQGITPHVVRYVLAASLLLAVFGMLAAFVFA
jgi:hypothetical protein